jgi:hypothetical protein
VKIHHDNTVQEEKKNYLMLSSYCFIALKNIIAKLMKKLIAE